MCVTSMVVDHYSPLIPQTTPPAPGWAAPPLQLMGTELHELRQLIAQFKEAMAAATTVDKLTGQPDCVDPEKATLVARVDALEKELNFLRLQSTREREAASKKKRLTRKNARPGSRT